MAELLKRAQRSVFRRPPHYPEYHAVPDLWQDERVYYYYLLPGRDKGEGDTLESPGTSHLAYVTCSKPQLTHKQKANDQDLCSIDGGLEGNSDQRSVGRTTMGSE